MSDRLAPLRAVLGPALVAAAMAPGVAAAMPWDLDMVDSDAIKAYEAEMRTLPAGVVSQPHLLTPLAWRKNYRRESPEGQALANPLDVADASVLSQGERMYGVYCTPCHGSDGVNLGPVAAPGRYPGIAILAGPDGRLQSRTDGHVYLTIRNGGGIMPSYDWAMNDAEMWSIVAYMRAEFDQAAYVPPAPASAEGVTP